MNNYKRLLHFLKGKFRYLIISLIMILIIQCLNFISPLIVKTLLDDYIMGIEYNWVEVETKDDYTWFCPVLKMMELRYTEDGKQYASPVCEDDDEETDALGLIGSFFR